MNFGFSYSKYRACDISLLRKYRSFSDGLSCDFVIEHDWYKADHNPTFDVRLIVFNLTIFEFCSYDIRHVDDSDKAKVIEIPCPYCGKDVEVRLDK